MARTKRGLAVEALVEKVNRRKAAEMVQIGARVPSDVLSVVDAIATYTGAHRSDVVRMLLKAALVEGLAETGEDILEALKSAGGAVESVRSPSGRIHRSPLVAKA